MDPEWCLVHLPLLSRPEFDAAHQLDVPRRADRAVPLAKIRATDIGVKREIAAPSSPREVVIVHGIKGFSQ